MSNPMTGWLGDKVASLVPAVLPATAAQADSCEYVYPVPVGNTVCTVVICPNSTYLSSCYP